MNSNPNEVTAYLFFHNLNLKAAKLKCLSYEYNCLATFDSVHYYIEFFIVFYILDFKRVHVE